MCQTSPNNDLRNYLAYELGVSFQRNKHREICCFFTRNDNPSADDLRKLFIETSVNSDSDKKIERVASFCFVYISEYELNLFRDFFASEERIYDSLFEGLDVIQ